MSISPHERFELPCVGLVRIEVLVRCLRVLLLGRPGGGRHLGAARHRRFFGVVIASVKRSPTVRRRRRAGLLLLRLGN